MLVHENLLLVVVVIVQAIQAKFASISAFTGSLVLFDPGALTVSLILEEKWRTVRLSAEYQKCHQGDT